jgi:GYD domain
MAAKAKPSRAVTAGRQQHYLVQFSYTSAAWDDLVNERVNRDRVAAVRSLVSSLGGCIGIIKFPCEDSPTPREKFVSFGDYDVVVLIAFPSDQAAAAFAIAISAGGGVTSIKTTRIIPWDEAVGAMGAAATHKGSYVPPGKGTALRR